MIVRHVVEAANVDPEGYVTDPTLACHGVVQRGRLWELSGPIDPLTHLNTDFPDHTLGDCVVAEGLQPGARMLLDAEQQLVHVPIRPQSLRPLGRVDLGARRLLWLEVHRRRRESGSNSAVGRLSDA